MAIELPGELIWVMDLLGLNWPEVNEDSVREYADHVRQFATNIDGTHAAATATIRAMADAYQASSYQQLADTWTRMSADHMDDLVQVCNASAIALEVAADVIIAAKLAVITQLGIMAAELAAAAATAVVTLGASAAAEAALAEVQRRIVKEIIQEAEDQVIGMLVERAVAPLEEAVTRALTGLVFKGVQAAVGAAAGGGGGAGEGFQIDPERMLAHAAELQRHAEDVVGHAQTFAGATSGVSFS
ncbi:hypothetical protein OG871_12075 [Kitasatospora sp. NBC_00374]|uniref:WXG100-like domain-containing protein n=1 Tax=Kitasatospora sp. NBC_00374 TaxID=2975964 RepID=UPI00324BCFBB